jgi:hypothetical protein
MLLDTAFLDKFVIRNSAGGVTALPPSRLELLRYDTIDEMLSAGFRYRLALNQCQVPAEELEALDNDERTSHLPRERLFERMQAIVRERALDAIEVAKRLI